MSYGSYVMGAPARINARLDEELGEKVEEIRRATKQTTTEVLVTALEQYHARVMDEARAYPLFSETGFIGCADGPPDLASEYKRQIDYGDKHGAPKRAPKKSADKTRKTKS